MGLQIDWYNKLVKVTSPTTEVDGQSLHDFIEDAMASARGLSEEEATTMVVSGFIEPLVKELPMEYAIGMNRLIQLQMEGSIG